jgi:hypothetical protein
MKEYHSHKEILNKSDNNYTWSSDNMKNVLKKGSSDMDTYHVTSISV